MSQWSQGRNVHLSYNYHFGMRLRRIKVNVAGCKNQAPKGPNYE